jgi:hypothetical protein
MKPTDWQRILPGLPPIELPWFEQMLPSLGWTEEERRIALDLHRFGYAVFKFPEPDFDRLADGIRSGLQDRYDWGHWKANGWRANEGLRIQDAWQFNPDVRRIACNTSLLALLTKLYGRRAFPFQTLNFPVGTQQPVHTDSVHFSSIPERFMCGVWVALEDIHPDSGPLIYYPTSHRWPIFVNEHLGVGSPANSRPSDNYEQYEELWRAEIEASGVAGMQLCAKKGEGLIWAANLLHGGARHVDPERTRWSQVTHYYFHDCAYFVPLLSDPALGRIFFKDQLVDITDGEAVQCRYLGEPIPADFIASAKVDRPRGKSFLPSDFDAALYLAANPDVAAARFPAAEHYLKFGFYERRKLRPRRSG